MKNIYETQQKEFSILDILELFLFLIHCVILLRNMTDNKSKILICYIYRYNTFYKFNLFINFVSLNDVNI